MGFAAALLMAMVWSIAPAWAGVGLAVVLDLPPAVSVGDSGLRGSLMIASANTLEHQNAKNLVVGITVTPSCGFDALSAECPSGSEDPGVITVDSPALGRDGTACGGTVFTVTERNVMTGQVVFESPKGFVTVGPVTGPTDASRCIIDFTFRVTDVFSIYPVSASPGMGTQAAAYAGAWAMSASGLRPGSGGNVTTLRIN